MWAFLLGNQAVPSDLTCKNTQLYLTEKCPAAYVVCVRESKQLQVCDQADLLGLGAEGV